MSNMQMTTKTVKATNAVKATRGRFAMLSRYHS